jgi:uncharacterized protein DUF4127
VRRPSRLLVALSLVAVVAATPAPASSRPIAFVPLDDRPVTLQLPMMLGAIAGEPLVTPPRALVGHYLQPGDPEAILAWLRSPQTTDVSEIVASLDMIAYGGLVASRVPGEPAFVAYSRLRALADMRGARPHSHLSVFGTIMRLAPTGVPRLPSTAGYWATGQTVDDIAAYANLPSPPQTGEQRAKGERLRARIGPQTLDAYLGARLRNRSVDELALQLTGDEGFDRIVLGQDDAGPVGLHVADLAVLNAAARRFDLGGRASIEPGADELGMVLVAHAMARAALWSPSVRVRYSRAGAASVVDPLEYVPIDATIGKLIAAVGARRVETDDAGIDLFVRVSGTSDADEAAFVDAIASDVTAKRSAAVADLTFLAGPPPSPEQQLLIRALIERRLAGRIDGFASWNTDANTVGTALAAAIAVGTGRRSGHYDARAHAQFMLDRYADDYAFHQFVRPVLNETLRAGGVDTTLLTPDVAVEADDLNRALLWPLALDLLSSIYPEYRDGGLTITLPWQRTFETQVDVRLTPGS